jgi:ATP-dependent DNA ligase
MKLPVMPPITPMLAKGVTEMPRGEGWLYEPKWDGFRAIVFRDGKELYIGSRNTQPLHRYFPELVEALLQALEARCVVDGEIVVAGEGGLDFDALQQRIHPAASRIQRLAGETPASFVAFDLLARGAKDLRKESLDSRRRALDEALTKNASVGLTPQTSDPDTATDWFTRYEGAGLDGVVAKRADQRYVEGERVMYKLKHERTCDCVVGGYRPYAAGEGVGSLLLGLYDEDGVLHFVGHTSSFNASQRKEVLQKLQPYAGGDSFGAGRTPGGPSRWTGSKDLAWYKVKPKLVCEVHFTQMQGDRFRHAARFLRWRTDKSPRDCNFDQLEPPEPFQLEKILS